MRIYLYCPECFSGLDADEIEWQECSTCRWNQYSMLYPPAEDQTEPAGRAWDSIEGLFEPLSCAQNAARNSVLPREESAPEICSMNNMFISLTSYLNSSSRVAVAVAHITAVMRERGYTIVYTTGGAVSVLELPEEVIRLAGGSVTMPQEPEVSTPARFAQQDLE